MELGGKRIWLTGASSGIGRALTHELAARGAVLALTSRNSAELERLAQELSSKGARATVVSGDVTNLAEMQRAGVAIVAALGGIDILIANAGVHSESWPERFDSAEYRRIMEVNYLGLLYCMHSALPDMQARRSGVIVGVASLAGYRGLPRAAAYGASKAAMIHFLESARFHLRRCGIRVVIVNPGFVRTPMTASNDFRMPFLMTPERAAQAICKGLIRERDVIKFPRLFAAFLELARILPYTVYDFMVEYLWNRMQTRAK